MKTIKDFLFFNSGLKALALVLASLVWYQVSSQEAVQRTLSAPVQFINMPPELEISNEYPRRVDMLVEARRSNPVFENGSLTVLVDLKDSKAGIEVVHLAERNLDRAPNVQIVSYSPARLRLQLERTFTKLVPVKASTSGKPAEGYEVTGIQVTPAEVLVSGPESHINQDFGADTQPVDVSGQNEPVRQSAFVDLDDPKLRIQNVESVLIIVQVEEKRKPYTVENVPVTVVPEDVATRLRTRTVRIVGTVPLSFEGELDASLFRVEVDASGLEVSRSYEQLRPEVYIPLDYEATFRLESIEPEQVSVRRIN